MGKKFQQQKAKEREEEKKKAYISMRLFLLLRFQD